MRLAARVSTIALLSACAQGVAPLGDASTTSERDPAEVRDAGGGGSSASTGDDGPERDAMARDAMDASSRGTGNPNSQDGGDAQLAPAADSGGTATQRDAAGGGESDGGSDAASPPIPVPDASVVPVDPCAEICRDNLVPDAKSCATPVTIGRKSALSDTFVYNGDTRGAGDKQDLDFISCGDGNADNFFRVFLYKDDTITIRLSTTEYDPVLKLVTGASCEVVESAACADQGLDGDNEILNVVAPADGWYHVVPDGPYGPTAVEGQGRYTLAVVVVGTSGASKCVCP